MNKEISFCAKTCGLDYAPLLICDPSLFLALSPSSASPIKTHPLIICLLWYCTVCCHRIAARIQCRIQAGKNLRACSIFYVNRSCQVFSGLKTRDKRKKRVYSLVHDKKAVSCLLFHTVQSPLGPKYLHSSLIDISGKKITFTGTICSD